jgi:hypothetical protein
MYRNTPYLSVCPPVETHAAVSSEGVPVHEWPADVVERIARHADELAAMAEHMEREYLRVQREHAAQSRALALSCAEIHTELDELEHRLRAGAVVEGGQS